MTEPAQDLLCAFHPQSFGQLRPLDHDDRQSQLARGIDLGTRACAAGIAGDDPFDTSRTHQVNFAGERERSTRNDQICIRQRQRTARRIDEAERVGVLRLRRERRDVLPADGQENIRPCLRQRGHGGFDVLSIDPDIVLRFDPWLALERKQRRFRRRTGGKHVAADLGCKGMGRIDHMRKFVPPDDSGHPVSAAETPSARRQGLIDRHLRSTGIGIDRVDPDSRDCSRQQICFARSAQDEDAHG